MKGTPEHRTALTIALLLSGALVTAPLAHAQESVPAQASAKLPPAPEGVVDVHVLGGIHALCHPPLKQPGDLVKLFQTRKADIDKILEDSKWGGRNEDLVAAVARGDYREIDFPVGGMMKWMALAKKGKPELLYNVRWAGKAPFKAFDMKVVSNDTEYHFIIPHPCGNLALIDSTAIPTPVASLSVTPPSDCITRPMSIDASRSSITSGSITGVSVLVETPDGKTEELTASSASQAKWSKSWRAPGTYRFSAVATADNGKKSAPAKAEAELKPCPPSCALSVTPDEVYQDIEEITVDGSGSKAQVGTLTKVAVTAKHETGDPTTELNLTAPFRMPTRLHRPGSYSFNGVAEDDLGQKSNNSCQSSTFIRPRLGLVLDVFGGKERRSREEFGGGHCAPLVGAKAGISYMIRPSFEMAVLGGVAFNTDDIDLTTGFADLEFNWRSRMRGAFFGAGVGVWDFTDSDTIDGDLLVHGGFDLPWKVGRSPVALFMEGRVFFDELDDIENNYVALGGLRFRPHN